MSTHLYFCLNIGSIIYVPDECLMVLFVSILEIVIFVSYCTLSMIVLQLYIKNARNLNSLQFTSVVILTSMFLMFCALTHASSLWGGRGHDTLTLICAIVSSLTAVVTIKLRSSFDEMLTNRFRAVKLVKDETILDLMNGYNLNINVANRTIVSGMVNGKKINNPKSLSFDGKIGTGSVIDVNGDKFRIYHKIQSNIRLDGVDRDIENSEHDDRENFSLLGVDVTDEFKSQQLVTQAKERQLAMSLSTAHEIRTPLTSILVLTKILRQEAQGSKSSVVEELYAHLQMLNLVATNMMEVGRILGGYELIPTYANLNMRSMFSRMKLFSQYMHDDNVEVSFNVEKSVPEIFASDEKWVWQIFLSFMTSALKFTSAGYIKANCKATKKNLEMFVTICVTDSGIGITDEDRSQLFEMYVEHPRARAESNRGVGLYTVKKKLGYLGGFCSIVPNTDDNVESGSVFEATFPVMTPDDLDEFDGERSLRFCSRSIVKSILVVDDTSTIILVMKRALADHHVDVAHNGKEALDLMLQKEYDYVFMDLSMPFMGGLEATASFREKEKHLGRENKQVIIMTSATEIDRPDIFDMKLPKPIDLNVLKTLLS